MFTRKNNIIFLLATMLVAGVALADSTYVEVCYYTSCDDGDPEFQDIMYCEAGETYRTLQPPVIDGFIFTHWEITPADPLTARDFSLRALDEAIFVPYQDVSVIARYVSESIDSDDDGISDGLEIYWYGSLAESGRSDTDRDGLTFAEELRNGTNPHFSNTYQRGCIRKCLSEFIQINPVGAASYIIRPDDGGLFAESTNYAACGTTVVSPSLSPKTSTFAYWTVNGEPMRDAFGRALDCVSLPMPNQELVIEAKTEQNEINRYKLYWYGTLDIEMDSDTDGDGLTFAEEILKGTNPHFAESKRIGKIRKVLGDSIFINVDGLKGCIIRSEGAHLVSVTTNFVDVGNIITSPSLSPKDSLFAYWRVNGEPVRDAFGRAKDCVDVRMTGDLLEIVAVAESNEEIRQKLYWYGTLDIEMDSDTDGDGLTFAEELINGTNPHFPNERKNGSISKTLGQLVDVNGQGYEKLNGVVIDGEYIHLFDSGNKLQTDESVAFRDGDDNPVQIWPVIADVNGDGKWDIVVCWGEDKVKVVGEGEVRRVAYLNVGSAGNPEFVEGKNVSIPPSVDLMMNSTAKLAALTLDVEPINALSATTNGATLLVSDTEGRIWFYEGNGELGTGNGLQTLNYQLQHKVWGGSHAGFANGLRLAAVDWEDDGDLDCICGTAEGKLMLLRNPKVGRPTNLKALAGVDNVLLIWDPNQQSRIRGYKVYRGTGNGEQGMGNGELGTDGYTALVPGEPNVSTMYTTALPRYRDFPNSSTPNFSYKVSSISRFYTAGNSTPTITESPATEAVSAQLGSVKFFWNDVVCKLGENANVMLSIENSMNYNVAGKTQTVKYDPTYLRPLKIAKTGLTENVTFTESFADGEWQIAMTGGTLPAGGGKFLTLVFETLKEGETTVGGDSGSTVTITARSEPVVPYQLGDVNGDGKLDKEDLRELARLKNGNGRKYTSNQLKAGDFNGNGKLDNADYQALRELLKEKGVL